MAKKQIKRKYTSSKKKNPKKNNGPYLKLGIFFIGLFTGAFLTYFVVKDDAPLPLNSTETPQEKSPSLTVEDYEKLLNQNDSKKQTDSIPQEGKQEELAAAEKPKIALVIDDLGLKIKATKKIINLPVPLTLAFLPYGPNIQKQVDLAISKDHEIIVHVPMEALSSSVDPGPHALKVTQDKKLFDKNLHWNLSQFTGYSGINNHMGSKLTADTKAMTMVMKELKKRNLYFLDSRTTAETVAKETALKDKVPLLTRDVFLDHKIDKDYILKQLDLLEKKALKNGFSIGIGHPHKETIDALLEWHPQVKDKVQFVQLKNLF